MSDARKIIANGLVNHGMTFPPPDAVAVHLLNHLNAAGFRIIGPDEVDPVTLETVLEAINEIAARGYSAAYRGGAMDCDAAIRNLGRKA